jgi:hypothetical protein
MSWHWVGPVGAPDDALLPTTASTSRWRLVRSVAVSAAVGVPVPPRAFTMLSSVVRVKFGPTTISSPSTVAMNPPARRAESTILRCAARSSGASPCAWGLVSPVKMRGELTIAACSGWATGTLMTSMRNSAEFGSCAAATHPASSWSERTGPDPET